MTDPLKTLQKIRRLCRRVEQASKNKDIRLLATNGTQPALVQDEVTNKQARLKPFFSSSPPDAII